MNMVVLPWQPLHDWDSQSLSTTLFLEDLQLYNETAIHTVPLNFLELAVGTLALETWVPANSNEYGCAAMATTGWDSHAITFNHIALRGRPTNAQ